MIKIADMIGISNCKLIFGNINDNIDFNHFSKDSRIINDGDVFIGLKGENFDGNDYYQEAFKKGAKTCILEKNIEVDPKLYPNKNLLIVDNMTDFLVNLASPIREKLNIPIIAVTGSVGKTSTKNIIASVLASKYKVLKTEGNLNTLIGMALTLLRINDEEIIVIEMGMNHKGEIAKLSKFLKPTIGVITNIGTAHIGNLGSRENILQAKLEILEGLKGPLIINNDNDLLNIWAKNKKDVITYGIDTKSNYIAENITYTKEGSSFFIENNLISINVIGKHFIYNSLVAYIIGKHFNVSSSDIMASLKNIPLEKGRMELISNSITIINDTYNASYDSVYYALEVLKQLKGRKIAVLGDIKELGDYSIEIHEKIGELIVKNQIDILITSGEYTSYINKKAEELGLSSNNSYHLNNNKEIIDLINKIKKDNDNYLIKASNSMKYQEIVEALS